MVAKKVRALLFVLFFFSGFSALVYEVLWLKELRRLFGSTAYATSTTLAVFFFGLAVGGYFWPLVVIALGISLLLKRKKGWDFYCGPWFKKEKKEGN